VAAEAKMTGPAKPALDVQGSNVRRSSWRGDTAAFTLGRTIEVAEMLDAWLPPDHLDGACYILRNDALTGRWELTMFDRSGAIG
jgi:hypothetical protein